MVSLPSLPSWERGLKSKRDQSSGMTFMSLPSWERGLKYENNPGADGLSRRSPRGSAD